jgi:hypothetical protein
VNTVAEPPEAPADEQGPSHDHPDGRLCIACELRQDSGTTLPWGIPIAGMSPATAVAGAERVDILQMLGANYRVTISENVPDPIGYRHGWCYRGLEAAAAAVAAWDPLTQDEPPGWHKRATPGLRCAPDRDPGHDLNRGRCVHGVYRGERCEHCKWASSDGTAVIPET